jgi:hypothetical protein
MTISAKWRLVVPVLVLGAFLLSRPAPAAPAHLVVDTYPCFLGFPCPGVLPPRIPPIVRPGESSGFYVGAFDASGFLDTGFRGTVRFTSSDPLAVLPADFTFTGGNGSFAATFGTIGQQTITATDLSGTHLPGSFQWRVTNQLGSIPTTSKPVELLLAILLAAAAWTLLSRRGQS